MKRRDFLQTSVLGCALATIKPAAALATEASCFGLPAVSLKSFELDELTITDLGQGLKSGKFTSRMLVQKYIERINDIDKKGPGINSVLEINPDAVAIAEGLDRERKEKG